MKNFTLILMMVLVLMFSSNKAFAGDDWVGSLSNQFTSGVSGLARGDFGGVVAGVNNFVSTAPVLSSVYSAGQWTGKQLSNIGTDASKAYSTGGGTGLLGYVVTAPFSGAGKIASAGMSAVGIGTDPSLEQSMSSGSSGFRPDPALRQIMSAGGTSNRPDAATRQSMSVSGGGAGINSITRSSMAVGRGSSNTLNSFSNGGAGR